MISLVQWVVFLPPLLKAWYLPGFSRLLKTYLKHSVSYAAFGFVKKYVPVKGRYLDIGCGNGSLLYFFKKDGWVCKGLELSDVFAKHVKANLDIEVEVANFLDFDKDAGQYELVSLRHVLEHLPDSVLALTKIRNLLSREGYALFEFPNIDGLTHRLQRIRNKIGLFDKNYPNDYAPGHCNEFSLESFEYLLNHTGFSLVRWETYSAKNLTNWIYNRIHIGTKARAIVKKL